MTDERAFEPDDLPTPNRPWSHGYRPVGRPVYISGQTSVDATGTVVHPGDIRAQFEQALSNVERVMTDAGGTMADLTELTVYVTNMDAWREEDAGSVRYDFLEEPYPCSTLIAVSELARPEYLVEVKGVAHVDE